MPFGKGKIVFCGDANLWMQVPQPLVKNTLHWFASPWTMQFRPGAIKFVITAGAIPRK